MKTIEHTKSSSFYTSAEYDNSESYKDIKENMIKYLAQILLHYRYSVPPMSQKNMTPVGVFCVFLF